MAVKQTFTSDTTQLEKAMSKLERMNTRLIEQNRKLAAGSQGASRKASSGFGGWIKGLAGVAAGYFSVQTAIRGVIQEIKDKEQLENRSKNFTLSLLDAQTEAVGNLGTVSGAAVDDFNRRMEALAKKTKVKGGLATIYQAASTGLSSSTGNVSATESAVRAAAAVAPNSPETIEALTQALLHLGKATGTNDARKNLGLLLNLRKETAATDINKIAEHMVPGIVSIQAYGGTAQEASAIGAAITQYTANKEPRRAMMAGRQLASQITDFLPEETTYKFEKDRRGRARKVVDVEGTGLKSPLERIRYLQEHPEARTQFLAGASFGEHGDVPIQKILGSMDRGPTDYLGQALKNIPSAEMSEPAFLQIASNMSRTFEQKIGEGERIIDTTGEELMLTPAGRKRAADALYSVENLDKTLQKAGVGGWARTYRTGQLRYARNIEERSPAEAYEHAIRGTRGYDPKTGKSDEGANLKGLDKTSKEILLKQLELLEKLSKTILHGSRPAAQAAIDANLHQHGETGAL